MRPEPIVRWPTSELPIWPGGRPTASPGRLERRVRVLGPEPVEHRRVGQVDGVARARRGAAPAVEDDQRYERARGFANRCERLDVERGAADERAVDVRLGEQLGGVVRLDRAAVEDGHVDQLRMNAWASCACSGVAVLPGADRPDRLVGDDELLVRLEDATPAGGAPPPSPPPRARPRSRRRRR